MAAVQSSPAPSASTVQGGLPLLLPSLDQPSSGKLAVQQTVSFTAGKSSPGPVTNPVSHFHSLGACLLFYLNHS